MPCIMPWAGEPHAVTVPCNSDTLSPVKRLKLYLDTSVLNFVFASEVPEHQRTTTALFKAIDLGVYEGWISDVVMKEIERAPARKRAQLEGLIAAHALQNLPVTEAAVALAAKYVSERVIPAKHEDDALHIALAVVHHMDIIVSWNFEHIVKVGTRRKVSAICQLVGYPLIEIASPEEVISGD